MLQKNNSWPSLLLGAGLILIVISFLLLKKWNESASSSNTLARTEDLQGDVFLTKKFSSQKIKISSNLPLTSLDTLETSADGQVLLDFLSSYRVRVLPNSAVTLEENGEQTLLILKQGDVQIENFGREGSLMISKLGRRISATEFELEKQNKNNPGALPSLPTQPQTTGAPAGTAGALSQEDVQGTLQKHKPMFFKCYTQLLQKTPGVTGQVNLAFVIEKTGKISQPEITNSSITDAKFRSCLLEALSRVEFRAFSGDPVSTVFPLRFE